MFYLFVSVGILDSHTDQVTDSLFSLDFPSRPLQWGCENVTLVIWC